MTPDPLEEWYRRADTARVGPWGVRWRRFRDWALNSPLVAGVVLLAVVVAFLAVVGEGWP